MRAWSGYSPYGHGTIPLKDHVLSEDGGNLWLRVQFAKGDTQEEKQSCNIRNPTDYGLRSDRSEFKMRACLAQFDFGKFVDFDFVRNCNSTVHLRQSRKEPS